MLPAYGRELLEIRRSGKRPARPVYVVDDWQIARQLREEDRFVLVADDWRRSYDFEVLRGLDVIAVPTTFGFVGRILPQIRAARPRWARRTLMLTGMDSAAALASDAMRLEAIAAADPGTPGRSAPSTACA